jgi:putative transposase
MPRAARKKSKDAMYHVMSRSISEVDLFRPFNSWLILITRQ